MITIEAVNETFEREPLGEPFGFKGGYVSEIWQTVALLRSRNGHDGVGLGTQSVLWSDSSVFAAHTQTGGNVLMAAIAEFALQLTRGVSFHDPMSLQEELLSPVVAYAKQITRNDRLRKTFVLNALVSVDNAAWMLYARERGFRTFDEMIPQAYRAALAHRHQGVASIPTVAYGTNTESIRSFAESGTFVVKVKLGHPGTQREMIEKDMRRLEDVHAALSAYTTEHTAAGHVLYYLDANGRYESKDVLVQLLDHAGRIGALERIVLVEEPFPEEVDVDVSDLGVRIAADESAHTDADTKRLIDLGYGAIALKPVAKTLSMTFKIADVARDRGVPCFCADLTVNPILVDWNKSVAARLAPLPGLDVGLLETNGHQYYRDWERMTGYHPAAGASWTRAQGGIFDLTDEFYDRSAGILEVPRHYLDLVQPPVT